MVIQTKLHFGWVYTFLFQLSSAKVKILEATPIAVNTKLYMACTTTDKMDTCKCHKIAKTRSPTLLRSLRLLRQDH